MSDRSMRWAATALLAAYSIVVCVIVVLSDASAETGDRATVLVGGAIFLLPLVYMAWRAPKVGWVFVVVGLLMGFFWLVVGASADAGGAGLLIGLVLGGPLAAAGVLFLRARRASTPSSGQ